MWPIFRYKRNVDDSIITRGAEVDESVERLQNWTVIIKTIKIFYRVSFWLSSMTSDRLLQPLTYIEFTCLPNVQCSLIDQNPFSRILGCDRS